MSSYEIAKVKVLIVDDDRQLLSNLGASLRNAGFEVDGVANGAGMRAAMNTKAYGLMLLDLRLDGEDGSTLVREIRQFSQLPIIMISGSADETDRILLLELGADDFLMKPFSVRELLARMHAVLRRATSAGLSGGGLAPRDRTPRPRQLVRFGRWTLDLDERELIDEDGELCELTAAEFRLLDILVRQPHRVWTREQLMEQTRTVDTGAFDRTIDVLILRLRRKIEPNPRHPQYICTERGTGYLFAGDVVMPSAEMA